MKMKPLRNEYPVERIVALGSLPGIVACGGRFSHPRWIIL